VARCPFALWKPLPENRTEPLITPTQVILHSAVSSADSLHGYFARADVDVESHFYVRNDGTVEQYLDTNRQADANYKANARAISIETEDDGRPDLQPWTGEQQDALVRLIRWAAETHAVPIRQCPQWDQPGVGWHSMWGAPGAWTPVRGKTCPGRARIPQVRDLIKRAAERPPAPSDEWELDVSRMPTLRRGSKAYFHNTIMQGCLVAHQLLKQGDTDMYFGPNTERALNEFKRRKGLPADGTCDGPTWERLTTWP
jgi:peptidoglycan hydrolase-like protein with peptidoglycan-binding domain